MTKAKTAGMTTALGLEHTYLVMCWKITRTDNQEFFFTDHDQFLTIDGDLYSPFSFNKSAISDKDDLSVDNLEIVGAFELGGITEQDVWNGLFDYARVEMFLYDWNTPANDRINLRYGRLGEVRPTEAGFFFAELRGLAQQLATRIVEKADPECRADVGDSRCKVPIDPPAWSAGVDLEQTRFPSTLATKGPYEFRLENSALVTDWIRASARNNRIFRVSVAGRTNPVEPTWDTTIGNTTSQPWAGFTAWSMAEVVTVGTVRRATASPTDKLFVCTTAGTTGGSEPTWNTTVDGTTNDNGVIWTTYPLPPEFVTVDSFTKEGSVDGGFPFTTTRKIFHINAGDIVAPDDTYQFGVVTWTSGDNNGRKSEVKEYVNKSASYVENVGSPNLDFDQIAGNDIARRDAGSWITDGFVIGMRITVSGSPAQDGTYLVLGVTAPDLTISGDWPAENLNTTGASITGTLRQITLFEEVAFDIADSTTFLIFPGCQKRPITDCKLFFKNLINFRGEDRLPGNDARFAYPDARG